MKTDLDFIKIQHLAIGMESSSLVASTSDFFAGMSSRLVNLMTDVKGYLQTKFNNELVDSEHFVGIINQALFNKLVDTNYTTVKATEVFCPPGLSVSYDVLIDALEEGNLITSKIKADVLQPTLKWLSSHIVDPSKLTTFSGGDAVEGLVSHNVESAKTRLQACFQNPTTKVQVVYGDAFKRNADVRSNVIRLELLREAITKVPVKEINELVSELTKRFDVLIRKIESESNFEMSGNKVRALSNLCYTVAQVCEFYALYVYTLQSTFVAIKDSELKLSKALNVI